MSSILWTQMSKMVKIFVLDINDAQMEKDGNVLFNDGLETFYLRLYGIRHGKGSFR